MKREVLNENNYTKHQKKEVCFKKDLIDILKKNHIKPIRYIFGMADRTIVDRNIYINEREML